jgi:hypothetical protein
VASYGSNHGHARKRWSSRAWRAFGFALLGVAAANLLAACEGCSLFRPVIESFKVEPTYIECVPGTLVTYKVSYQVSPDTYTVSLEEGTPSQGPTWKPDHLRPAPNGTELSRRQDSFQRTIPCVYGDYPVTLIAYGEQQAANGYQLLTRTIQIRPPGTATGNPHLSSSVVPDHRVVPID